MPRPWSLPLGQCFNILLLLSWIAVTLWWSSGASVHRHQEIQSLLDRKSSNRHLLDIVIASYHKDGAHFPDLSSWSEIPSIRRMKPRWIRYDKENHSTAMYPNPPRSTPDFDKVIYLPNVGREGHTYLYHIVHNYVSLARHTIFCQAEPHGIDRVNARLETLFGNQTGFLSLSEDAMCACSGECFGEFKKIGEFYAMARKHPCPGEFFAAMRGCFVVSRKRIVANPFTFYKYLLQLMEASIVHPVHALEDYPVFFPPSTESAPALGHLLERSWAFIFHCDGGVGHNVDGCIRGKCKGPQCLDDR